MNRIRQPWAEDIAEALMLTTGFEGVDFLCGVDPVFAGLHEFTEVGDGRLYAATAHCALSKVTSDRRTTIVLQTPEPWDVIVHELGHVLDERQGWRWNLPPVSRYAMVNRMEAFAEAFLSWTLGPTREPGWAERWEKIAQWDPPPDLVFAEPRP